MPELIYIAAALMMGLGGLGLVDAIPIIGVGIAMYLIFVVAG